jgi:response regulator of citrate/malate metabolism
VNNLTVKLPFDHLTIVAIRTSEIKEENDHTAQVDALFANLSFQSIREHIHVVSQRAGVDHFLKPVQHERLEKAVQKEI